MGFLNPPRKLAFGMTAGTTRAATEEIDASSRSPGVAPDEEYFLKQLTRNVRVDMSGPVGARAELELQSPDQSSQHWR